MAEHKLFQHPRWYEVPAYEIIKSDKKTTEEERMKTHKECREFLIKMGIIKDENGKENQ